MDLVRSLGVLRVENSNWRMVMAGCAMESGVGGSGEGISVGCNRRV